MSRMVRGVKNKNEGLHAVKQIMDFNLSCMTWCEADSGNRWRSRASTGDGRSGLLPRPVGCDLKAFSALQEFLDYSGLSRRCPAFRPRFGRLSRRLALNSALYILDQRARMTRVVHGLPTSRSDGRIGAAFHQPG